MQTVTLLIDKRRELSTKYKKLLENKNNKVLISKSLISSMKIIQDTEPDLIIISDSVDSDLADYCKKIRAYFSTLCLPLLTTNILSISKSKY